MSKPVTARRSSPEYKAWGHMIERCRNPNTECFADYGGRGITVCDRWRTYEHFLADMGPRPAGMTLERKDNERGYEPGNCVWATRKQQMRNRRNTKMLTFNGETKGLTEWAEQLGLKKTTLEKRLKLGWTADRALSQKAGA